jgi:hypothetical protein
MRLQQPGAAMDSPLSKNRLKNGGIFQPAYQTSPGDLAGDFADDLYDRCGNWACDRDYPAFTRPDLLFTTQDHNSALYRGNNVCAHYTFKNDQAGEYCYDTVNGPPPAEGTERCGDGWMDPVALGPDWAFYKVPFTELRQEGWAKRFPRLDQAGVTMVRFTWSVGWVDYWIDDVRFYRKAR